MQTAGPMLRSTALATAQPSALVVPKVPSMMQKSMQSLSASTAHTSRSVAYKSGLTPRIAIDCGNVISVTDNDSNNLSEVMDTIPSDECVRTVTSIVRERGSENVFVLSKCRRAMQQAVVVMFGKTRFFERTGLLPSNVLFCTLRSGGSPPAESDMRLLDAPNDYPPFSGQLHHFVHGPRYAPGNVGKGALATTFRLTSLIDDRSECLASFYFEGLLRKNQDAGILLQALWGHNVTQSLTRRHVPCHSWEDVLLHLREHHGHHEPVLERVESCAASTDSGVSDEAYSASVAPSDDEWEDKDSLIDSALQESGLVATGLPVESAIDVSTSRIYKCGECGTSADVDALGEDGKWYCRECWEAFLSHDVKTEVPSLDEANVYATSTAGSSPCDSFEYHLHRLLFLVISSRCHGKQALPASEGVLLSGLRLEWQEMFGNDISNLMGKCGYKEIAPLVAAIGGLRVVGEGDKARVLTTRTTFEGSEERLCSSSKPLATRRPRVCNRRLPDPVVTLPSTFQSGEEGVGSSTQRSTRRPRSWNRRLQDPKPSIEKVEQKRLYTCGDCGESPELGAVDEEDGNWYCKACWEVLLSKVN